MFQLSSEHRSKMNVKEDLIEELQTNLIKENGKLKELHSIAKEQLALATKETSFEMDERCRSEHESTALLTKISRLEDLRRDALRQLTNSKEERSKTMDKVEVARNEINVLKSTLTVQKETHVKEIAGLHQKYNRMVTHEERERKEMALANLGEVQRLRLQHKDHLSSSQLESNSRLIHDKIEIMAERDKAIARLVANQFSMGQQERELKEIPGLKATVHALQEKNALLRKELVEVQQHKQGNNDEDFRQLMVENQEKEQRILLLENQQHKEPPTGARELVEMTNLLTSTLTNSLTITIKEELEHKYHDKYQQQLMVERKQLQAQQQEQLERLQKSVLDQTMTFEEMDADNDAGKNSGVGKGYDTAVVAVYTRENDNLRHQLEQLQREQQQLQHQLHQQQQHHQRHNTTTINNTIRRSSNMTMIHNTTNTNTTNTTNTNNTTTGSLGSPGGGEDMIAMREHRRIVAQLEEQMVRLRNKITSLELSLSATKAKASDSVKLLRKNDMEYKLTLDSLLFKHQESLVLLESKHHQQSEQVEGELHTQYQGKLNRERALLEEKENKFVLMNRDLEHRLKEAVGLSNKQHAQLNRLTSTLAMEKEHRKHLEQEQERMASGHSQHETEKLEDKYNQIIVALKKDIEQVIQENDTQKENTRARNERTLAKLERSRQELITLQLLCEEQKVLIQQLSTTSGSGGSGGSTTTTTSSSSSSSSSNHSSRRETTTFTQQQLREQHHHREKQQVWLKHAKAANWEQQVQLQQEEEDSKRKDSQYATVGEVADSTARAGEWYVLGLIGLIWFDLV